MTLWPYSARRVERLQFNTYKVPNLTFLRGHEDIVDAPPGHRDLGHKVKLIPRLVSCKQVQTVSENLPAFNKSGGANDDRSRLSTVENSTGANRNLGTRFSNFVAALAKEGALLIRDDRLPVNTGRVCSLAE